MHQARLQRACAAARRQQIFHPDLRTVFDPDHLRPQPVLGGECLQGSGQDQIGLERLANLLGGEPALRQVEDRIPGQHRNGKAFRAGEGGRGFFRQGQSEMFRNEVPGGEGHDGQPNKRPGRRRALSPDCGREAVAALVNSLDAHIRLKPRAQAGHTLGNAVCRHMHIAPQGIFHLRRRDHLGGVRYKQSQRREFLGRQVNHHFAAPQRTISIQPEAGKRTGRCSTPTAKSNLRSGISTPAAKACHRCARISTPAPGTFRRGARISTPANRTCLRNNSISTPAVETCHLIPTSQNRSLGIPSRRQARIMRIARN